MDFDLKIFGERNTATNALKQCLESNSASRCVPSTAGELDPRAVREAGRMSSGGGEPPFGLRSPGAVREHNIDRIFALRGDVNAWKHAATRFDDVGVFAGLSVLICVRNPASWLLSLYKNPYHIFGARPASLKAFVDFPWQTVGRERLDYAVLPPLELYEAKLSSYLAFAERFEAIGGNCRFVRFEQVVTDQETVFAGLGALLKAPNADFRPLTRSTKRADRSLEDYRDYYGQERWREEMGTAYDVVRQRFSKTLSEAFGYEL